MKRKELDNIFKTLNHSKISNCVKNGLIRVIKFSHHNYYYNDEDVYKILIKDIRRKIIKYKSLTLKQK